MERWYSNASLPQGFTETAKHNLVKKPRSETNLLNSEDYLSSGDHEFKSKRRKTWSRSTQELCAIYDRFVAPSNASMAKRKLPRVPSQDDLFKSILKDYTFLMADDLIIECQETKRELCLPLPKRHSPKSSTETYEIHPMITFDEFLDHFNEIHDTLHSLQSSTSELSETKYGQLNIECQNLKEQASILKLMNPELTDDINRRSVILRNKLQLLENLVYPQRLHERDVAIKSLTTKMKEIRKWLQEVDSRLRKLKISDTCDTEEMNEVFSQEKVLQREIEGRGKELTSIVRQCESLEGATVAESKRLRRAATHLERSWHNIWIRSLEKQCITEQRLLEQRQVEENNHRESSDLELDEGPLNKHRRLTLDRWTAVSTTMDRTRRGRDSMSSDVIKNGLTKDVGVVCGNLIPVNDKCIMVGTTGIAALKAEYGDDFTNVEIIQDVGYSSESSTHLSSDDNEHRYIRVYNYHNNNTKCTSLKEELEDADKQPQSLASSLGSSSSGVAFSINDSGIGHSNSASDKADDKFVGDLFGESDYLEKVLESCTDFYVADGGAKEDGLDDLQYKLSGMESDDSADNFQNRSSFMTSSQLFYKMISVESENDEIETETRPNESSFIYTKTTPVSPQTPNKLDTSNESPNLSQTLTENVTPTKSSPLGNIDIKSDTEQHSLQATLESNSPKDIKPTQRPVSPFKEPDYQTSTVKHTTPNLKRKRDSEPTDFATTTWQGGGRVPHRVRSWLKRQTHYTDTASLSRVKRCLFRNGYSSSEDSCHNTRPFHLREDISSCDASGECTSSSADEGNVPLSSTSFDDLRLKEGRLHGSVETVLRGHSRNKARRRLDNADWIENERLDSSVENVLREFTRSQRFDDGDWIDDELSAVGSCKTSPRRRRDNVVCVDDGLTAVESTPRRHCPDVDWIELSPMLPPPPMSSTPACLRNGKCKSRHSMSMSSCGDMRWLVLKASSEGDLRRRIGHLTGSEHSLTNIPSGTKHKRSSPHLEYKHRLCSSLPNVLRHRSDSSAEDAKTSQSESKSSGSRNRHDESLTSVVSHNQSSSSDLEKRKKRRNRRKSSSSNRSSRSALASCDSGRHRTRTLTGSRGRHYSQKSDFFDDSENGFQSVCEGPLLEEIKTPSEEINHTNLKDELQLALEESCRNSAPLLLSPAESDVVLTHLEEQSTVSDQVWDGYQDMPYLSEAYSEATVDEDAVRKLTEFGDDYGSAIGQPMRFMDTANGGKTDIPKSPSKKSSKAFLSVVTSNDSDSDLEDLHHVIEEAEKALHFARATLKRRQSGDFFSSTENAELLATCGTHLHCLQAICEFIEADAHDNNFSCGDLKELHNLIEDWIELKRSIEMFKGIDDSTTQKYIKARKSVDDLFDKLSELSMITDKEMTDFKSWEDLQDHISNLQMLMNTLQDTKELLLGVNVQVHRFVTEYGDDQEYKDCSLKEDVTELYQRWEDIYEKNGLQLTKFESISSKWKIYIDKFRMLRSKVDAIHYNSSSADDSCDKSNISSKDLRISLASDLTDLQRSAEFLRSTSIESSSWKSISLDLKDLEHRIERETRTRSHSRNLNHPKSSATEDDPDDDFEGAIQILDKKESHAKKFAKDAANLAKKSSSRLWRVIRVAVPVQLTLVLLFCLACYLEPNCCDRLNNFSFSLTPHLRYLRGPPPV